MNKGELNDDNPVLAPPRPLSARSGRSLRTRRRIRLATDARGCIGSYGKHMSANCVRIAQKCIEKYQKPMMIWNYSGETRGSSLRS